MSGRIAFLVFGAFALSGCAVGPSYHAPAPPAETALNAGPAAAGADLPADWWRVFRAPALDDLVAEALARNPTIAAARAALRAAHETTLAQRGAYYPSLSAGLQPSRQLFARTLASPTASGGSLYSLTTAQVSVSYAPDIFGGNRRAVESLAAQETAQRFELEAARLTLAGAVVQAAIQDALLRDQIATTQAIIADQTATLDSFRRQHTLGQVSNADIAAQEALLAQTRATLPPLQKQFEINRDLLAALVGRAPGQAPMAGFDFAALTLPEPPPPSLPAELVRHRPDVRIAEAQLHAASAQVGVAEAARWPSLQIDANAGGANLALTPAFNSASNFWSVAAGLTQPVFQGGSLLHRERAARANYDAAAAQYQSVVVGALQNTADVLRALAADGEALRLAEAAQQATAHSLAIAQRQFTLGDVSRLALLAAQQADAQARLALLQARANRYNDVVALYQALGGGWWNRDQPGPARR